MPASHAPSMDRSPGPLPRRYRGANPAGIHGDQGPSWDGHHGFHAPRDHGTSNRKAARDIATLRPWSIVMWVARDSGRRVATVPRSLDLPCPEVPGSIATSQTQALDRPRYQGTSTSSVRGPSKTKVFVRTSGHQQLVTFISSVALLPGLDRSLDDLVPSPRRRPWPLIEMGPPTTWVPRPPTRRPGACGMIPSSSTCQGARSASLTAGPRYQVIAAPGDPKVPSSQGNLGPSSPSVLPVPRYR
jgi:hypothetical protein